jgi:hypothetical protein
MLIKQAAGRVVVAPLLTLLFAPDDRDSTVNLGGGGFYIRLCNVTIVG